MQLKLYIDEHEVELNSNVNFPLNKSYEDLADPISTYVDYSKSINIPMTKNNNKILGNAYRLDRVISGTDRSVTTDQFLGLYMDPTKRIPFRLTYNEDTLIEGYCKYVSADIKEGYYTMNLYGALGDIFQKLSRVVVSKSELEEDQGSEYVLDDGLGDGVTLSPAYIYKSFRQVYNEDGDISQHEQVTDDDSLSVIGFAPAHRGMYEDFDSSKVQTADNEIKSIEDMTGVAGDFPDWQMHQFRFYEQRPFIYFCQLMYMYKHKLEELSDYKLELDNSWFCHNNPFWSKMVYMLDYMKSNVDSSSTVINPASTKTMIASDPMQGPGSPNWYSAAHVDTSYPTVAVPTSLFIIDSNTITIKTVIDKSQYATFNGNGRGFRVSEVRLNPRASLAIRYKCEDRDNGTASHYIYYWASTGDAVTSTKPFYVDQDHTQNRYNEKNFLKIEESWEHSTTETDMNGTVTHTAKIVLPASKGVGTFNELKGIGLQMYWTRQDPLNYYWNYFANNSPENWLRWSQPLPGQGRITPQTGEGILSALVWSAHPGATSIMSIGYYTAPITSSNCSMSYSDISIHTNYKDNTKVKLGSFYNSQDPNLWNVIMQYTKMFGLCWDIDYKDRKIKLGPKKSVFENYTAVDWTDKVNVSKGFVIEPITFSHKFLNFNYDETEGAHYSDYAEKYGYQYGSKRLVTNYNFDAESQDLFEGISPSCSSSRPHYSYAALRDAFLGRAEAKITEENVELPDMDDKDQTKPIEEPRWFLREKPNTQDNQYKYWITPDSDYMINQETICHYDTDYLSTKQGTEGFHSMVALPRFSYVGTFDDIPSSRGVWVGSTFNQPKIDWTAGSNGSRAAGSYIYDLFWRDYIDERYNIQNKKVTGYFRLTPLDYINFKYNQFVTVDNQLFMVNKIFDYDVTGDGLTKCELVQITNPDDYINGQKNYSPLEIDSASVKRVDGVEDELDVEEVTPNSLRWTSNWTNGEFQIYYKSSNGIDRSHAERVEIELSDPSGPNIEYWGTGTAGEPNTFITWFRWSGLGTLGDEQTATIKIYEEGSNNPTTWTIKLDNIY